MPYLGDYLGQLMAEISKARMIADLESVRLAELYAAHPLLRTLPIPHVKLPEVDLDIPLLIKASEEPRPGENPRGGATMAELSRKFDEVLTAQLAKSGIQLSAADNKRLRIELDERILQSSVPTEVSVDVTRVADDLSTVALNFLKKSKLETPPKDAGSIEVLSKTLNERARFEFFKLRTPATRLSVIVTSSEIRELGTSENLTRFRLKVSEQDLERTTIELDGILYDRLIPE